MVQQHEDESDHVGGWVAGRGQLRENFSKTD